MVVTVACAAVGAAEKVTVALVLEVDCAPLTANGTTAVVKLQSNSAWRGLWARSCESVVTAASIKAPCGKEVVGVKVATRSASVVAPATAAPP